MNAVAEEDEEVVERVHGTDAAETSEWVCEDNAAMGSSWPEGMEGLQGETT